MIQDLIQNGECQNVVKWALMAPVTSAFVLVLWEYLVHYVKRLGGAV